MGEEDQWSLEFEMYFVHLELMMILCVFLFS